MFLLAAFPIRRATSADLAKHRPPGRGTMGLPLEKSARSPVDHPRDAARRIEGKKEEEKRKRRTGATVTHFPWNATALSSGGCLLSSTRITHAHFLPRGRFRILQLGAIALFHLEGKCRAFPGISRKVVLFLGFRFFYCERHCHRRCLSHKSNRFGFNLIHH